MSRNGPLLGALSLLALIWLQFSPFLNGYFLTADDVLFHYFSLTGTPLEWLEQGWRTAIWKSKLGEISAIPLAVLGNSAIESAGMQIANVVLFIGSLAMFAAYLGTLFGGHLGFLVGVVVVALSPLHFYHMTPTSYPLYLSLQIMLGFACLIALWRLPAGGRLRLGRMMAFPLLFLVLVSSEYMLFFIGAATVFDAGLVSSKAKARLWTFLSDRRSWTIALAFMTHILFQKIAGTGHYTSASGHDQLTAILNVQIWHTLNGVTLGPAALSSLSVQTLPDTITELVRVLVIGAATFACTFLLLKRVQLNRSDLPALIGLCLFIILCLTLPVALLQKYRNWCVAPEQCAYLDSRYAGWALAAVLGGVAAVTAQSSISRILWSISMASLAVLSALHNDHVAERMIEARAPWRMAQTALCGENSSWDAFLASDTATRIPFHVTDSRTRQNYWIAWASVQDCSN